MDKASISSIFTKTIDEGLFKEREKRKKRNYIGASGLGKACNRAIQLDFLSSEEKILKGSSLRVFERGNLGEKLVANFLRKGGFKIATCNKKRHQFEFSQLNGRFKGHIDGIIRQAPKKFKVLTGFQTPALWENKVLMQKYFKQLVKKGLKAFSEEYYGQMQIYMAYFNLYHNPGMFTALNPNEMTLYCELVQYDPITAQNLSDKAVFILKSTINKEPMGKISNKKNWACNMCSWSERCFETNGN